MKRLGTIVMLQIQRSILANKGVGYDPGPLLQVDEAAVGAGGISGVHDGGHLLDVHHTAHPSGRGGGNRTISIGFTGHYDRMQGRFGRVPVGIGGENLIVGNEARLFEDDLAGTIVIKAESGEIELAGARVAAPCREFTSFLLGRDDLPERDELAPDLEFLHQGMRGFILDGSAIARPTLVRVGDEVLLRD